MDLVFELFRAMHFKLSKLFMAKRSEEEASYAAKIFLLQMYVFWVFQRRLFLDKNPNYWLTKFNTHKTLGFSSYQAFLLQFVRMVKNNFFCRELEPLMPNKIFGRIFLISPMLLFPQIEDILLTYHIPDHIFMDGNEKTGGEHKENDIHAGISIFKMLEHINELVPNEDLEYIFGALFEKTIDISLRKKKGAFYTPKALVNFLCHEVITRYLLDRVNDKFGTKYKEIEALFREEHNKAIIFLCDFLKNMKILDPAVGSGHFLEGITNELLDLYRQIWVYTKKRTHVHFKCLSFQSNDEFQLKCLNELDKREFDFLIKYKFIYPNLYGVDIDPNAVYVTKIRLFMFLTRDLDLESRQQNDFLLPLSLELNIKNGDALLGIYDWMPFKSLLNQDITPILWDMTDILSILKDLEVFFSALQSKNKKQTSVDASESVIETIRTFQSLHNKLSTPSTVRSRTVRHKLTLKDLLELKSFVRNSIITFRVVQMFDKILRFNSWLEEICTETLKHHLQRKPHPFSLSETAVNWPVVFPEVFFQREGFDLVLGNPPYLVEVRKNKEIFRRLKHSQLGQKYYEQKIDLFYLFMALGIDVLRTKGILGFVVQEYWLTRRFAQKIRKKIFNETIPIKFILFGDYQLFPDAPGQHNMILLLQKNKVSLNARTEIYTYRRKYTRSFQLQPQLIEVLSSENIFKYFDYLIIPTHRIYDAQLDTVFLLNPTEKRKMEKWYEKALFLKKNEIQLGLTAPQNRVTKNVLKQKRSRI